MEKFGMQEGEELTHPWLNRSIETAQRRVEQHHFSIRKRTLQYDDVMNKQREVVYGRRKEVLLTDDPRKLLFDYLDTAIFERVQSLEHNPKEFGTPYDREALLKWLYISFPIGFSADDLPVDVASYSPDVVTKRIMERIETTYAAKEKGEEPEALRWLERQIMLAAHDKPWQEHLYAMDNLRQEIVLQSYGQRDPLVEYKKEAFAAFGELIGQINQEIANSAFRSATSLQAFQNMFAAMPRREIHRVMGQFDTGGGGAAEAAQAAGPARQAAPTGGEAPAPGPDGAAPPPAPKPLPFMREEPKVGRNDLCPCGSGKKFKKCHGQ
jgi:preprotein translocase subunit SecA